ncbi:tetratricopeptide repeat protein [Azospirillum sp.]|uniref:tetratricopeptide repeat protein n=1 Tax=Azospirillum sp. TaxID=34012 RepID=UPI0026399E2D|nr:tetratricopeptide repeat protein [Azospirillum sp.]
MMFANTRSRSWALAAVMAGGLFMVDGPANAATAKSCDIPKDSQAALSSLSTLSERRHSVDDLLCASLIGAALADRNPNDVALNYEALHAQVNVLEHIDATLDESLYVSPSDYAVTERRWNDAAKRGKTLIGRLQKAAAANPDIATLIVAQQLISASKFTNQLITLKVAAQGLSDLEAVVKKKPDALHGIAQYMLGRLRLFMPAFVGGDTAKAVAHLKAARDSDPGNIEILRWQAEALMAERDNAEAQKALTAMLPLEPTPTQRQQFADQLRAAAGLATRVNDAALQTALAAKRDALLAAHPELLARKPTASSGHGGVDPLTGKSTE